MAAADTRPPDNRLPFRPASCRMTHNPPRNGAEDRDAKANPTGKDLYRATCFVPTRCLFERKRETISSTRRGLFSTLSEKRERRKDLERGVKIKFSKIVTTKILN